MRHPRRRLGLTLVLTATSLIAPLLAGCQTDAGTGVLIGSAAGAGLGAIIGKQVGGHTVEGALIGAAVGESAGYLMGNERDRQKASEW